VASIVIRVLFVGLFLFELVASSQTIETEVVESLLTRLVNGNEDERGNVVVDLARTGDQSAGIVLEHYRLGSLNLYEGKAVIYEEIVENDDFDEVALLLDPMTEEPLLGADGKQRQVLVFDLEEISPSRDERKAVRSAEVLLRLSSKNDESRFSAVKRCGQPPRNLEGLPFLEEIAGNDSNEKIRYVALESMHLIQLGEAISKDDSSSQLEKVKALGYLKSIRSLALIEEMIHDASENERSDEVVAVCIEAKDRIDAHQRSVNRFGSVVQGISLGSILILMALGLAVTFGLMGVINMAHGELMMVGAYTTYEMQRLFGHSAENSSDLFYLVALPASFVVAALAGAIIEVTVVRHLYRKPLESLLATWGVGLILIQLVRVRYGDNIGIISPTWARGGVEVMQDVMIPYARIYILGLCGGCVGLIYYLMNRTPLGLRIRAVMQNRDMANSLGVNTKKVDLYTFALGSGVAGVAGYAWTIIGGVTPDMGQQIFIVDSFLVVVTGGVGELMGVVCSGLGIGVLTKLVEPLQIGSFTFGPVWAKVVLLIGIITFIQFKPAGLFAPKGRLGDV
jgi:urea transport system permease protein